MSKLALIVLLILSANLEAGGGPDDVALVVNGDSPASLAIANAWIAARDIDPGHVVVLHGLPDHERITVEEFRGRILLPVMLELERRGLDRQVQILVYSADLPWAVDFSADIGGAGGGSNVVGRIGSLTGLTVLAPLVAARLRSYARLPTTNPYHQRSDVEANLSGHELAETEQQAWSEASRLHQKKEYPAAAAILAPLADATGDSGVLYDLACALALAGEPVQAMQALVRAERAGWNNAGHTRQDSDLTSLRTLPEFIALLARLDAIVASAPPSFAWRRAPGGGWLSTMLAVTSGRGLSVREAIANLRRSAAADATRPDGTVFLMRNGDVRSTTRRWAFSGVVAEMARLGAKAEILDGILPGKDAQVIGAVVGSPQVDWPGSGSTVLPGAICEHLTSLGGVMDWNAGQTPLTAFLRHGATGASGTVEEPYALQYKFPSPFIQVHYRRGCTLAEAFWQSVAGPYQLLVVGDPLCAPWAQPPVMRVTPVGDGTMAFLVAAEATGPAIAEVRVHVDGRQFWRGPPGPVTLNPAQWPAGPHRLAFVGVAAGTIASQARYAVDVTTGSGGPELICETPRTTLDGTLRFRVRGPTGVRTALRHLGRELAVLATGGERTVELPSAILGLGVSSMQLETSDAQGRVTARSAVLNIEILEPAPRLGVALAADLAPGLRLRTIAAEPATLPAPSATAAPVQPTPAAIDTIIAKGRLFDRWLEQALPADQVERAWTLDGWFQVTTDDDLHQIQVRGQRQLRIRIDGDLVALGAGTAWHLGVVRLGSGWHRLRIEADAGKGGCEIRLGAAGARPLDPAACRVAQD